MLMSRKKDADQQRHLALQGLRQCRVCDQIKPLADFSNKSKGKVDSMCRPCAAIRQREYMKGRPRKRTHRDRSGERKSTDRAFRMRENRALAQEGKRRCGRCQEIKNQSAFAPDKNPRATPGALQGWCRECGREASRLAAPKIKLRQYGLTDEQFKALLAAQGGACAICGATDQGWQTWRLNGPVSLAIDHDHTTDAVRGLLCGKCNQALGILRDDPALIRRAIDYLRSPPADRVPE